MVGLPLSESMYWTLHEPPTRTQEFCGVNTPPLLVVVKVTTPVGDAALLTVTVQVVEACGFTEDGLHCRETCGMSWLMLKAKLPPLEWVLSDPP